jgi:hypothetical protein
MKAGNHLSTLRLRRATFIAGVLLVLLPKVGIAEDLFEITASGAGITRSVSGSSVVDLINNAINVKDTFSVFEGTAFTADLNYAGVSSAIQFSTNAAGTSATLSIPSTNFTRTFSGLTRAETERQLEDFLKTDATGVIADFYKAVNSQSLVAVTDGNPRSATAMAAADTYNLYGVMVARTNEEREKEKDLGGSSGFGAVMNYSSFSANGIHGSSYSLLLAVPFRISRRVGFNLEIPLNYQRIDSAKVFGSGAIAGVPIKIMSASKSSAWSWQITPFAGVTGSASEEMAAGGLLSIAGAASVIAHDFRRVTVSMGNMVSFHSGIPLSVGDYHFDPGVRQTILKNGGKVDLPLGRRWILDGSLIHTNFTNHAALSHYDTVGGEIVYRTLGKSTAERNNSRYLRVGVSSDLGNNYRSTQLQFGSAWKF